MNYENLPKIELHLHLDCSLSYSVVQALDPSIDEAEYLRSFVAPPKCLDLADYIARASSAIALMQSEEALFRVTLDLFDQLRADHILYAEIRFAPLEHTRNGLSARRVVQAVADALREGAARTGIAAGLILCTLRHYSEKQSLETVRLVEQFLGTSVVGFDIASDEATFPVDHHLAAFHYAWERGIPCTAHAGEARGPDSVWETLRHFHPRRIGHGVRSVEDPALMAYLKEHDLHLEICPTSNIQTNVFSGIEEHPVDSLFSNGISLSINTDSRTVSKVTLTEEYHLLRDTFNWTPRHFLQANLEAIRHAFTTTSVKSALRKQLLEAYAPVVVP